MSSSCKTESGIWGWFGPVGQFIIREFHVLFINICSIILFRFIKEAKMSSKASEPLVTYVRIPTISKVWVRVRSDLTSMTMGLFRVIAQKPKT